MLGPRRVADWQNGVMQSITKALARDEVFMVWMLGCVYG
jgi:hypothetical protein